MDEIRFFADQHYPAPVTNGLLQRGIDVTTAQSVGRCGADDPDQLAYGASQGRVLLTFDSDFLNLAQQGIKHSGIVWCPATKYGIGDLIQMLLLLHGAVGASEMVDQVEYL